MSKKKIKDYINQWRFKKKLVKELWERIWWLEIEMEMEKEFKDLGTKSIDKMKVENEGRRKRYQQIADAHTKEEREEKNELKKTLDKEEGFKKLVSENQKESDVRIVNMQGEIKTLQRRIRYIRGEQPRAKEIDIDKMVEEKKEAEQKEDV